ncbi:MAG: protein TolQ [Desulfobacterales bacterium]|nr:protein TolQ [Desulfobacterales bacterium]MCP4158977.1 protein TolQ [Deltaproteobacteria bacterium]
MTVQTISIIEMISGAGIMVKSILLLLLVFSIASWAIMVIKLLYIRKSSKESEQFTEIFWRSKNLSEANTKAKNYPNSPVARIYRNGYTELKKVHQSGSASIGSNLSGTENVERSLRRSINTELTRFSQMIPFLATAGNTTPFIGLFGTVWGIMDSFQGIGKGGSASLAVVAPGISEALVATAAGLAVAIPAVIGYNYFANKIKIMDSELEIFSADFLNIVERDVFRKKGQNNE